MPKHDDDVIRDCLEATIRDCDRVILGLEEYKKTLMLMQAATEAVLHKCYEQAKRKGARSEGTKTG